MCGPSFVVYGVNLGLRDYLNAISFVMRRPLKMSNFFLAAASCSGVIVGG